MRDVGFFGGSFDPIQLGHINLAIEIKEKLNLKKIIFCPANISPFKVNKPPIAKPKERLEMIKLAIKDIDYFDYTDIEIKKEGVSYTIDTLEKFKNNENLRLIITDDTLLNFHLWKDYKKILEIAPLIVGVRNKNLTLTSENFVKTSIFEISSTEIRNRLKKGLIVSHLLPKEVLDYIYERKIYL